MKYLLLFLLVGCGSPEYTPWGYHPKDKKLTKTHIDRLGELPFESFKVALAADSQAVVGHFDNVRKKINDSGAEFTLVLGDLTDRGLQQEFNWFADIVKRFDKPVLTVVGNHDGLSKGKDIYREMFGEFNYSFIYRDIKFIAWNNNPYEFNAPDLGWLRDEVESHSRVIVYAHQPPYGGSITDAQEAEWKEIRQSPNMIASIHGHTHKFNYYVEAGTGVPVYTTSRVENTKFGYMEIKADGVVFSECSPECREVN